MNFKKRDIVLTSVGSLFLLLGLLLNEYLLGNFLTAQSSIGSIPIVIIIRIIDIGLIAWGLITIIFRNREFVVNLNIAIASLIIFAPLLGEVILRSGIYLDLDNLRNPGLYAGFDYSEDYWKLRYQWQPNTWRPKPRQIASNKQDIIIDPFLGWAPQKSADNPLGILSDRLYTPDFSKKTILFYGDSFVYGVTEVPIEKRIPQQFDDLILDYKVYNYGVPGYGTDQILLRFQDSHGSFQRPFIIIGLLTLDLDRAIFAVREVPKPYFEIADNKMVLKGVPTPEDPNAWFRQHPPGINSYLVALAGWQARLTTGFNETEIPYKQTEKKTINTEIIKEMVREAQSHNLPLLFVIFYPEWELTYQGWRELYLKDLLNRLQVPYIDTKQIFLRRAEEQAGQVAQFYYPPPNNHLNELGSRIVAEAIAEYFVDTLDSHIALGLSQAGPANAPLITIDSSLKKVVGIDPDIKIPWPTEKYNNQNILWLGHGEAEGIAGVLWSDELRWVNLEVEVWPGPAREDSQRTVQLVNRSLGQVKIQRKTFDAPVILTFSVELQPGRNPLLFFVLDQPTVSVQPNGDTRDLSVALHHVTIKAASSSTTSSPDVNRSETNN